MSKQPGEIKDITSAYALLNLGDAVTTDHISPAGNISRDSVAGKYLMKQGISRENFNSYGSRRGNDLIMARGTFANVKLVNKMASKPGPWTTHVPSGKEMAPFEAAMLYKEAGQQLVVLGGQLYGNGSSRDWAAKGPYLQGVRAVIAESFERIHRSNLLGMGILPLQFQKGWGADTLGLDGHEQFTIKLNGGDLQIGQKIDVTTSTGTEFKVTVRLDTEPEINFWRNGGILHYVLRNMARQHKLY